MMAALPRASASEITPSPAKTAARPTGVKPSQCAVTRPVARQSFVFPFVLRVFSFRPFQDRCRVAVPRGPPSTSRIYPQALCRAAASTFGTRTIPLSTQATPHTPRFPFRDRDSPRLSGLLSGNRQSWGVCVHLFWSVKREPTNIITMKTDRKRGVPSELFNHFQLRNRILDDHPSQRPL